jgi:hypothetical protein
VVSIAPVPPQYQAAFATIVVQLLVLGNQVQPVPILTASLQTLIVRLVSLTSADPTVAPLLAGLRFQDESAPTVGSLVAKVVLLDQLLARLIRADPLAAQRLAKAVPMLRSLVASLLSAGYESPESPVPSAWINSAEAALPLPQPLLAPDAAGIETVVTGGSASWLTLPLAAPPVRLSVAPARTRGERTSQPSLVSTSASIGTGLPPSPSPPGGGVGSTSGGLGMGAPAAAGLLAVWVGCALATVMYRRFESDPVAWRAMFLAPRLERPG